MQPNTWKYFYFLKIFSPKNILHSKNILHMVKRNLILNILSLTLLLVCHIKHHFHIKVWFGYGWFRVCGFFFFSVSYTIHWTWTLHLGLWIIIHTVVHNVYTRPCAILLYCLRTHDHFIMKKILKINPLYYLKVVPRKTKKPRENGETNRKIKPRQKKHRERERERERLILVLKNED